MADSDYAYAHRPEPIDAALEVEGTVPDGLVGTFYGMVVAGTRVGDLRLHLLDGHGKIVAVELGNGPPRLRARMVETPLWHAEKDAAHVAKRRLAHNKPSRWSNLFDTDLGNPASHNVVCHGDDLLALADPGFYALDPKTLATRGDSRVPKAKGASLGPMPRRDPATGRLVVLEIQPGLRDTVIVRELGPDCSVAKEQAYRLPHGGAFVHDLAFSDRYYLAARFAELSIPKLLWGAEPALAAVSFDPASTPVAYLMPRAGGPVVTVKLPERTHFHWWNARDDGDAFVLDAIVYPGQVTFDSLAPAPVGTRTPVPFQVRYRIDPAAGTLSEQRLSDLPGEGPAIHPERRGRAYRYGWAATPGTRGDESDPAGFPWFHGLVRYDFEAGTTAVWDAGPRCYVSAPAFVPRAGGAAEDHGHLLSVVQDLAAGTTSLVVLDAAAVERGPVARLRCVGPLGVVVHTTWA